MKQSRDYQQKAPLLVHEALVEGHTRICIVSPTGSGKTYIAKLIMTDESIRQHLNVVDRPINVLFASHRKRLLEQAVATYENDESINITVRMLTRATVNTEVDQTIDLIFVDEAHHESADTIQKQLPELITKPMIGLTATPDRNDKKVLKFSKFIDLISRDEAIARGFLSNSEIHSFMTSPSNDRNEVTVEIVNQLKETIGNTMIFCRTKNDAEIINRKLNNLQYSTRLLVDIDEETLNNHLDDFAAKKYQFAISCMKLGEGVDVKNCETVLLQRKTNSKPLLNQYIGRCSRPDSKSVVVEIVYPVDQEISAKDIVTNPISHTLWIKQENSWKSATIV